MKSCSSHTAGLLATLLFLAACGSNAPTQATSVPEASGENIEMAASFPPSLNVFGDGYPAKGSPCRRLGESASTSDWLDASADLVGCPTKDSAKALGGRVVGKVEGITVVSVPMGDENRRIKQPALTSPIATSPKDIVRGKGGLEDKCKAAVAKQGTNVIGTNRIDESQAAIEIYVNVENGAAPWRCRASRDGTISDVEFTGDEGAL